MPGSSNVGKIGIEQWVDSLPKTPKAVLDVGPGWGTYSRLLRKRNQVWHAVEIHAPYVDQFNLRRYYDKVFIEDIRTFEPRRRYDLVLLGDILEHIPNEDGLAVLAKLMKQCSYVILSLPLDEETNAPSENNHEYWANPHERHQALWSNGRFLHAALSLGADVIALAKYSGLGIYLLSVRGSHNFIEEKTVRPIDWLRYHVGVKYETNDGTLKMKALLFCMKHVPEWMKRIYRKGSAGGA